MAIKNQGFLEKLQELELSAEADKVAKQLRALDLLVRVDLTQPDGPTKFRGVVRTFQKAFGLDDAAFVGPGETATEDGLSVAGDAAGNSLVELQQQAARQLIMLQLDKLDAKQLHAIHNQNDDGKLRGLLKASSTFPALSAPTADSQLPQEILEDIRAEAERLATIKDIEARVAAAEAANNAANERLTAAVTGLKGDATDGPALQQIHADYKKMAKELADLQAFRASQDVFLNLPKHADLKRGVDAQITTISEQLDAATASIAGEQAKILAFMTAQKAAIAAKVGAVVNPDTIVANRNGNAAQKKAYEDFRDLRIKVWETRELLLDALALDTLVQGTEKAELKAEVTAVEDQLKTMAQHGAVPLVEDAKKIADNLKRVADRVDVRLLNMQETDAKLREVKETVDRLGRAMEQAKFFHSQPAGYITTPATESDFNAKYTLAKQAYDDALAAYTALQDRAKAKYGDRLDVTGAAKPVTESPGEAVLLRATHDFMQTFSDTVIRRGEDFNSGLPVSPGSRTGSGISAATASATQVTFEGTRLIEGDVIRSAANFGKASLTSGRGTVDRVGVIRQDHQGKVSDESQNLLKEDKQMVAFKMARMLLANYKPGDGAIILRSDKRPADVEMGNMVYAALLLLKQSHPTLKNIEIDSRVPGVTGPAAWTYDKTNKFIKEHLGDVAPKNPAQASAITKSDREEASSQLASVTQAKYKEIITKGRLWDSKKEEYEAPTEATKIQVKP